MKKKFVLKAVVFAAICFLIVSVITPVFVPVWYPATDTVKGFQQEEENTIDVLFLGTSRTAFSACPWLLWEEYGIAAYSLGVEQQPTIASVYFLKEALKKQDIKVVAIEAQGLNRERDYDDQEAPTRENFDNMPLTFEKLKTVWEICQKSEEQNIFNFIFPFLRYHDRWSDLSESNFESQNNYSRTKGAVASFSQAGISLFSEDFPESSGEPYELPEETQRWLDEMIEVCEENNVDLLFYATPTYTWTKEQTNFYQNLCENNERIHFIDFNNYEAIEEIGFDLSQDFSDTGGHVNIFGGEKMMRAVGAYMQEVLQVPDHRGDETYDSWEVCVDYVDWLRQTDQLTRTENLTDYLRILQDPTYTFAIAVCDDAAAGMTEKDLKLLRTMGLEAEFETGFRKAYIAVVDHGQVLHEAMGDGVQEYQTTIGEDDWYIQSIGFNEEIPTEAIIEINEVQYDSPNRGLFIVVYDKEEQEVLDIALFDPVLDGENRVF